MNKQQKVSLAYLAHAIACARELSAGKPIGLRLARNLNNRRSRNKLEAGETAALMMFARLMDENPEAIKAALERIEYLESAAPHDIDMQLIPVEAKEEVAPERQTQFLHSAGSTIPPGLFKDAPMPPPELPHSDPGSPFHQYWLADQNGQTEDWISKL